MRSIIRECQRWKCVGNRWLVMDSLCFWMILDHWQVPHFNMWYHRQRHWQRVALIYRYSSALTRHDNHPGWTTELVSAC